MKVRGTMLKEKHIVINQFNPSPKMQIKFNRVNLMPPEVVHDELQCVLKLSIVLSDDAGNILVTIDVSYLVNAVLDKGDLYDQDAFANRIFSVLQSMYIKTANDMLRETPFPPLPMNIDC